MKAFGTTRRELLKQTVACPVSALAPWLGVSLLLWLLAGNLCGLTLEAARLQATAGLHTVGLAFLNDALANGQDRNLCLARLELSAEGGPEPALATPEQVTDAPARAEERILAESDAAIARYRKADMTVRVLDATGAPVAGAKVLVEQTRHEFLFGCNIYAFDRFNSAEQNEAYKRRFSDLFDYATVGFYWRWYEPEPGQPNYAYTDKVVDWCVQHGIRMKGHPLLWADQAGIPVWSQGQPSPDKQQERVTQIMRRYQGRIGFWEVVNEPSHLPGLKIDSPYRWARAADPKATLIVNDYHVLADGHPPFFQLLDQAIRDGVPFDGIGIQAHEPRTMRFPLERVKRVLDRYAGLGKALNITEFTPTSAGQPITGSHVSGVWDEAAQADYAAKFYRVCFAHPAMVAITWWDLCDAHSWLKGGGLLRQDLSPKPVYQALHKLIREQWHTRVEGATDKAGQFSFNGFCGQYEVRATEGDRTATGRFDFSKAKSRQAVLQLPGP
ncbi:MAG: endo-1,4-beta-xylanase [Verrucomicrobiota bacterium]|jgi:GH35 family endo-1,4-beta-xylanase